MAPRKAGEILQFHPELQKRTKDINIWNRDMIYMC